MTAKVTKDYETKAFMTVMEVPLTLKQVIQIGVSFGVGLLSFVALSRLSLSARIGLTMLITGVAFAFAMINIHGMSLFTLIIKSLKKRDVRYYCAKGIEGDDGQ